ncbi:MAG: translation initiation factor IF-3, partial [Bacilli bacterium]
PVCRFMDYSKYRYEMQKKAREAKKNQKVVTIKEIRLTPVISSNDFETKLKRGIKFLEDGDKLKVTLTFNRRARMLSNNSENNFDMIVKYIEKLSDIAVVESKPTLEGRNMSAILSPKKDK